jgi:hypothetical protein
MLVVGAARAALESNTGTRAIRSFLTGVLLASTYYRLI